AAPRYRRRSQWVDPVDGYGGIAQQRQLGRSSSQRRSSLRNVSADRMSQGRQGRSGTTGRVDAFVTTSAYARQVKGLVVLAASLVLATPARAAVSSRILYASDWSGDMELYAVDPSGREPVGQLTSGIGGTCAFLLPCGFVDPVLSPDGRMVVYGGTGLYSYNGSAALWIARADGSAPRLLAADGASPAWSPDSRWIAYSRKDGIHVTPANRRTDPLPAPGVHRGVG